jgi:hypothetical protein
MLFSCFAKVTTYSPVGADAGVLVDGRLVDGGDVIRFLCVLDEDLPVALHVEDLATRQHHVVEAVALELVG